VKSDTRYKGGWKREERGVGEEVKVKREEGSGIGHKRRGRRKVRTKKGKEGREVIKEGRNTNGEGSEKT
jgi:hypothetical protein